MRLYECEHDSAQDCVCPRVRLRVCCACVYVQVCVCLSTSACVNVQVCVFMNKCVYLSGEFHVELIMNFRRNVEVFLEGSGI